MKLKNLFDDYLNDKIYSMIYKNSKLNVINFDEIIDFSSTKVSLRHKNKIYNISGNELVISRMMDNEILITGNITNIEFN